MKRLGIPIWNNWVSPVFETSSALLIVDFENKRETARAVVPMERESLGRKMSLLKDIGIDMLICNGVSRRVNNALLEIGLQVIPCRSGPVEDIITAYCSDQLDQPRFVVRGMRCKGRQGRQAPCGGRRGLSCYDGFTVFTRGGRGRMLNDENEE